MSLPGWGRQRQAASLLRLTPLRILLSWRGCGLCSASTTHMATRCSVTRETCAHWGWQPPGPLPGVAGGQGAVSAAAASSGRTPGSSTAGRAVTQCRPGRSAPATASHPHSTPGKAGEPSGRAHRHRAVEGTKVLQRTQGLCLRAAPKPGTAGLGRQRPCREAEAGGVRRQARQTGSLPASRGAEGTQETQSRSPRPRQGSLTGHCCRRRAQTGPPGPRAAVSAARHGGPGTGGQRQRHSAACALRSCSSAIALDSWRPALPAWRPAHTRRPAPPAGWSWEIGTRARPPLLATRTHGRAAGLIRWEPFSWLDAARAGVCSPGRPRGSTVCLVHTATPAPCSVP